MGDSIRSLQIHPTGWLIAECRTASGEWVESTLNLNNYLRNVNGQLEFCYDFGEELARPGFFASTCRCVWHACCQLAWHARTDACMAAPTACPSGRQACGGTCCRVGVCSWDWRVSACALGAG